MKLKKYLQILEQSRPHKNILTQSVGDAILYHQNSIFRNIRKTNIKMGYSYSSKDALNMAMAKFVLLDDIKNKKVITYLPNIKILRELEKEKPNYFATADLAFLGKSFNPVFHESCHMICHEMLKAKAITEGDHQKDFALKACMEEAFTDTAECLMHITDASEEEKFSLHFNLYRKVVATDDIILLKFLIKNYGFKNVAILMMLISLQVHFMHKKLSSEDMALIEKLIDWPRAKRKHFESYCYWIFMLMQSEMTPFRAQTADFYFKLHGYKGGHRQALKFNPFSFIYNKKKCYIEILNSLAGFILNGEEKYIFSSFV